MTLGKNSGFEPFEPFMMSTDTSKLEDNICPICLYIYIKPVTMPCGHELCLACFKQNVEEANFCCPMCRTRISTWARRASRTNTLVNQKRWEEVQLRFPTQVQNRLEGFEEEDEEMQALNVSIRLAEPGEIRNEYEEQLRKLQAQRAEEGRKEQEASERLILELQAEEQKKREELEMLQKQDEEFAKALSQAEPDANSPFPQRTRSSAVSHAEEDSMSSTNMEAFLDKLRKENDGSKSPYPYTCLSPLPSGAGKLCVDKDKVLVMEEKFRRQKVKKDRNLITTQDIANLEEQFKLNVSKTATAPDGGETDCLRKALGSTTSLMATMTKVVSSSNLNQEEILNQMSEDLVATLKTVDNDDDPDVIIIPSPMPIRPTSNHSSVMDEESSSREKAKQTSERSASAQSTDSISVELSHFRPIRSCPLTPPRVLPGGKVVEPQLIRTTPRNLSKTGLGSPMETNLSDIDAGSPIMKRRLSELAEERKDQVVRLSKSTSTGSSTVDDDENRNPEDISCPKLTRPALRSGSANRGEEFKDISNSPFHKRKFDFSSEELEEPPAKKKPILALEPDLDESDIVIPDPLDMVQILPDSDSVKKIDSTTSKRNRLSRIRHIKSGRVQYTIDETNISPQPSITQWVKKGEEFAMCVSKNGIKDGFTGDSRDEVDSALTRKSKNKKNKVDDTKTKGLGTLDKFMVQSPAENKHDYIRPRRVCKSIRQDDFVYAESIKGTHCSRNYHEQDSDLESEERTPCKRSRRSVGGESDSSFDVFEGDEVLSEKSDGSFAEISPKRIRKDLFVHSPRRRKKNTMYDDSQYISLSTEASVNHKKVNKGVSKGKTAHKTMHDFFPAQTTRDRTREAKEQAEAMDVVLDQEERDRLIALELQKQFELEARLNISAFRFKGTKDEYSLRKKRKSSVLLDT